MRENRILEDSRERRGEEWLGDPTKEYEGKDKSIGENGRCAPPGC